MMSDDLRLEEQVLSQAAAIGLSSQLDGVESIDVDVRTDLLKIVQGQADSISLVGQGLVIQKDIRVQEIELQVDRVAIAPLSALLGKIELNEPLDADARLLLTEEDINRALNSDYIHSKIKPLELEVKDQPAVLLEMQQMELHLPGEGRMIFNGKMLMHQQNESQQVSFTSAFLPRTLSQPVILENFQCLEGGGTSLEITLAMLTKIRELVNLPYFDLETMILQIKDLEVHQGSLIIHAAARIRQLPSV
ncbi:MAG: DUF2993 domain-containing protein [Chroococcidiopsidaceae cyanobacterium CP_BM_ER_R8_30]|nr:DUF2993 domain-containing protein [Chroococcidiopsidaceae cyanobacterium CP_BM_ER_R8_30]